MSSFVLQARAGSQFQSRSIELASTAIPEDRQEAGPSLAGAQLSSPASESRPDGGPSLAGTPLYSLDPCLINFDLHGWPIMYAASEWLSCWGL